MGLIHWWPLNGDKNDHAGTVDLTSSSSTFVEGKVNKALQLNSVIAKVANPFIGLNNWSISFWVKDNGSNAWSDFICFSKNLIRLELDNASNWRWYIGNASTSETFPATGNLFGSGTILNSGASVNTWYHVTIVKKNTNAKFYLNGVLKNTSAAATNFTSESATMYFNSRANETTSSKMSLCDIRCYDHALSEAEIHGLKSGLLLHYNFECGDNLSIEYDCSGYEHNATVNGATTSTETMTGAHSAYFLDGGQWLEHIGAAFSNSTLSVAFWWKSSCAAAKTGYHIPFAIDGGRVEISIPNNGQLRWGGYINGSRYCNNVTCKDTGEKTFSLNNGKWHHIVSVFDGTGFLGYVDGVYQGKQGISGTISYTSKTLRIGKYTAGATSNYGATDAYISDVRIYNTVLNTDDIARLYKHTVKITPEQNLIGEYFIETGQQENINFLSTPYKTGGWGGTTAVDGNELVLTATNGWHSFVWLTPEHFKTKNAVLSFEYCFTNKDGWSDGVWAHTTSSTAQYLIGSGPKVYNTNIGVWTSISLPLTNLTDYIGWTLRGADGKGKHIVMRIRNPRLLVDKINIKIQPTGVVSCNGINQIENVRIEQHGLLTTNEIIEQ